MLLYISLEFPTYRTKGNLYESSGNSSKEILKKLRISLPLAALRLLSVLCLILYIRHTKKKKKKKEEENQNQQRFSEGSSEMLYINKSKNDDLDLSPFDFSTILGVTNNFSLSNKLGEGGFGPVYKIAQKQQPKQWQHKKDQKPDHIEGRATNSKELRSNGAPPNIDNMQNWQTVKNIPTSKGVSPPKDGVSITTTNGFTILNTGG
ncbi:hypothetical protein KY285_000947 [Solanum tuberosum]|nr:hypothetical protein KY285_000947 [Solanum tuberosum]